MAQRSQKAFQLKCFKKKMVYYIKAACSTLNTSAGNENTGGGPHDILRLNPSLFKMSNRHGENRHTSGHTARGRTNTRPAFHITVSSRCCAKGKVNSGTAPPLSFKPLWIKMYFFFFNDWVGRVEKQLAGTDSRGRKRKAGNAKVKKTVSLAREANIRLFHYLTCHGKKKSS